MNLSREAYQHSDQADQVAKDSRRVLGDVHIRQGCKKANESNPIERNALCGGPVEYPGFLAIPGQSIKRAGPNYRYQNRRR